MPAGSSTSRLLKQNGSSSAAIESMAVAVKKSDTGVWSFPTELICLFAGNHQCANARRGANDARSANNSLCQHIRVSR